MGMLCWCPLSPYTHGKKKYKKKNAHFFFCKKCHFYRGFIEKNDMEVSKCRGVAHIYIYIYIYLPLDRFWAHLFSLFGFKLLALWVSGWSFGFLFKGVLGIGGLKLELGTGWFEACAFLLVVILFLSSCFPNNMLPFFLLPLVILSPCLLVPLSSCSSLPL